MRVLDRHGGGGWGGGARSHTQEERHGQGGLDVYQGRIRYQGKCLLIRVFHLSVRMGQSVRLKARESKCDKKNNNHE